MFGMLWLMLLMNSIRKELNKRIKIIGTKNNLRMGIEAIEQMQNPTKTFCLKKLKKNFIKIDLSYVYGEYHECVKLIQYVKGYMMWY